MRERAVRMAREAIAESGERVGAVSRVHRDNFGVYGIEKVWRQLNRQGIQVGRDQVARLMDELKLSGVVRGKRTRTTIPH